MSLPAAIILATLVSCTEASMFNSQPKFILKAENSKAFHNSSLVKTINIQSGDISECLKHCLQNCRCQSFQICENKKCQQCSSRKEENSSLLHDKDGCVYATYETPHLTENLQNFNGQCSSMRCSRNENCCQESGLCPDYKICKPVNVLSKPWKRFRCACPDGFRGIGCKKPITSCLGYARGSRKSGIYKLVNSEGSLYEAYCHFDSDGTWTLVQSYSFTNGSHNSKFQSLRKSLIENHPVSENALTWNGYRLSKPRMKSIKNGSSFVQFTCNYEKNLAINKSDYAQIQLQNVKSSSGKLVDILELNGETPYLTLGDRCGKIGENVLNYCSFRLIQSSTVALHVLFNHGNDQCALKSSQLCYWNHQFFGSYVFISECFHAVHRCAQNAKSTTQLWFGMRTPSFV